MFTRVLKSTLAAVLLVTLAAAPAGAQGDGYGWSFGLGTVLAIAVAGAVIAAHLGYGFSLVTRDANLALAEETVDIDISRNHASVSAEYVFQNDGEKDKELELNYPFGTGRGVGPAADVTVTDGAGAEIPFERKGKNISFGVTVPAKSKATVAVKYGQPASGTTFTYLLGKDRFWGLGGAFTTFTVKADAALGKVDSFYCLKKVAGDEDCISYVYVRDKFYPTKNFTISWKKAAPAGP